ncbi:MAG TPA: hypothetical protein V6D17_24870 [Candidatus Obscuribacterales bacterium]
MQALLQSKNCLSAAALSMVLGFGMPAMAHHSGLDRLVSGVSSPVAPVAQDPAVKHAVAEIARQTAAPKTNAGTLQKERPFRFHRQATDKILILGGAEAFPM